GRGLPRRHRPPQPPACRLRMTRGACATARCFPPSPSEPWEWSQHDNISPDSTARSSTRSRPRQEVHPSHHRGSDAGIRGRRVTMKVTRRRIALATSGVAVAMFATACGSGGFGAGTEDSDSTDGATIDVIAVNLPAQEDLVEM